MSDHYTHKQSSPFAATQFGDWSAHASQTGSDCVAFRLARVRSVPTQRRIQIRFVSQDPSRHSSSHGASREHFMSKLELGSVGKGQPPNIHSSKINEGHMGGMHNCINYAH